MKIKRLPLILLTLSAAKFTVQNVAFIVGATWRYIESHIFGGGQELGLRSGTENVAGVAGFATAFELAQKRRSGRRSDAVAGRVGKRFEAGFSDMFDIIDMKKFGEF